MMFQLFRACSSSTTQKLLFFKCENKFSEILSWQGNKTDFVICSYDDHFLVSLNPMDLYELFMGQHLIFLIRFQVVATQIGSMGTILHARFSFFFFFSFLFASFGRKKFLHYRIQFAERFFTVDDWLQKFSCLCKSRSEPPYGLGFLIYSEVLIF